MTGRLRLDCSICDARKPLDEHGLCADCASFPVLVAAFRIGLARKEKRDGV